jgi:hypothetical protein
MVEHDAMHVVVVDRTGTPAGAVSTLDVLGSSRPASAAGPRASRMAPERRDRRPALRNSRAAVEGIEPVRRQLATGRCTAILVGPRGRRCRRSVSQRGGTAGDLALRPPQRRARRRRGRSRLQPPDEQAPWMTSCRVGTSSAPAARSPRGRADGWRPPNQRRRRRRRRPRCRSPVPPWSPVTMKLFLVKGRSSSAGPAAVAPRTRAELSAAAAGLSVAQ